MNTAAAPDSQQDGTTFELYKLAVEMADRVSARRGTANTFYLGLQTATVGLLGVLGSTGGKHHAWMLVGLCAAGAATGVAWFLQLRSYRDLNRAKFAVINELEGELPVAIFSKEWEVLKGDRIKPWRERYAELGTLERVVPCFFVVLDLALAVYFAAS